MNCLCILLITVSIHVFLSLSETFEKAETHFFTMSIKNSTIDSDSKNEEAVKFEARSNYECKEWLKFLCVLALASVIKIIFFPILRIEK